MDEERRGIVEMGRNDQPDQVFDFDGLPVEIKHQVLKKFKTKFLEDVCAQVSLDWQGMVQDILGIRRTNAQTIVPNFFRNEMSVRSNEQVMDNPLETLKLYESTMLSKRFAATSVQVNDDTCTNTGLFALICRLRNCDCDESAECLMRRLHIVAAFNLFVVDCDSADSSLRFYNLHYIERLERNEKVDAIEAGNYKCPNLEEWVGKRHTMDTGISVFRDHIVLEIAAKTVLMLKIASVDHKERQVNLERVRIVHLPIWAAGLCLFEDRLIILYTTGHVGMWDKNANKLSISTSRCELRARGSCIVHRTRLYRIGSLGLIRTNHNQDIDPHLWHVVDLNDPNLTIHAIDMLKVIDAGFIKGWCSGARIKDIFHLDIWYNCLIVQFQITRHPTRQRAMYATRLAFKRIQRYPCVEDFLDPAKFRDDFLSLNDPQRLVSVRAYPGYSISSPFVPSSLKPWQLEPPVGEPVPVADLIAAHGFPSDSLRYDMRSAFRIRLSNLPFNYKKENQ